MRILVLVLFFLVCSVTSQIVKGDEKKALYEICTQTLGEDKGKDLFLQIMDAIKDAIKNGDTMRLLRTIDSLQTKDLLKMGNVMCKVYDKLGLGGDELMVSEFVFFSIGKRLDLDETSEACLSALQEKTLHPEWRAFLAYNLLFEPYERKRNEKGIMIEKYGIDLLSKENKQKWLKVLMRLREDTSEDTMLRREIEWSIQKLQYILK